MAAENLGAVSVTEPFRSIRGDAIEQGRGELMSLSILTDADRAAQMLRIAAAYIREFCPDRMAHYDEADCDGYCVADDCETAALMLLNE